MTNTERATVDAMIAVIRAADVLYERMNDEEARNRYRQARNQMLELAAQDFLASTGAA